ncbi:MAG TPA: TonB-dependent receptor plug domain-containing protein [Opitutaceae bacterium]|nr:TonB-dependent receptor plug domain-containing protein [Opitutaceae bacterium]
MNTTHWHSRTQWRLLLALSALAASTTVMAQAVAPTDAATLARYDKNKNGRLDPDEIAAMQADQAKVPVQTNAQTGKDDVVELSPFQVSGGGDKGYYASNTMSGTRLNSKIEDLAAAVSVVTKQQMSDFAMLDINDIFAYETSTEGTGNFTDYSVDRNGMVTDGVQNNPQGANRIRGGSAANIALNNFASSGRVPIDPIGIDAVEISRGPNSNIFGLGQGSGTVNLVGSKANLNRDISTVEFRTDDNGGYRSSIDLSRPIFKDKLAVRAQAVYQHDAYREKPSGGTTRRYNFMVRVQPFKKTTIDAIFQDYDYYGTRPSAITPRDAVSYWQNLGRPTWDPLLTAVTVNGVQTVTGSTTPTGMAVSSFNARPAFFVDGNGISLWEIQQMPAATATNGPNNVSGTQRLLETAPDPVRTNHPLFSTVRGISSKSMFDWSTINLAAINSIKDHNENSTVDITQNFFRTGMNQLDLELAWNREYATRLNKNVVGQSSATGNSNYLYVDVNEKLLDGRPNPYFLRPYLGVGEPIHSSNPYLRDTFRTQLAYSLDFTKPDSHKWPMWTKWLGRHQIVGYMEEKLTKTKSFRFRDVDITDNPIYAPAGQPKGNQSGVVAPGATRGYFHFYVGDNKGQNIDYSPSPFKYGTYTFNWFNPQTNAWVADQNQFSEGAIQEGAGGNSNSQNLVKTRGAVMQSYLIDDRVVLTGGKRHDDNYNKFGKPSVLLANGYTYDYAAMDGWVGPWAYGQGDTTTKGFVLKPFRNWPMLDRAASEGGAKGFFAGVLSGMDIHYNKADSFLPDVPAIAVTLESLPNPTSNGKDYGFSLNFWNGKVVLRANRYQNASINTRNGQFGTFGQRTLRLDFENFAGNNDNFSLQKQARLWVAAANPTFTSAQVDTAVFGIMGISAANAAIYNSSTISETQDQTAKGDELEINFNPDNFWTFKINATKEQSIDANVAPHIFEWTAIRQPIWNSIIDPRSGTPWFTTQYTATGPVTSGGSTATSFLQGNVVSPINLAQAIQGKSRPEVREYHINLATSLRLAKYSSNRYLKNLQVGGGVRYESKGGIGYYGIPVNGDISAATAFDPNRPIYDKGHTYIDAFVSYNMRLFNDKVRARIQLNGRNLQDSNTRLQSIGAYADGSPYAFRIVDPRTYVLTATFDL